MSGPISLHRLCPLFFGREIILLSISLWSNCLLFRLVRFYSLFCPLICFIAFSLTYFSQFIKCSVQVEVNIITFFWIIVFVYLLLSDFAGHPVFSFTGIYYLWSIFWLGFKIDFLKNCHCCFGLSCLTWFLLILL